MAQFPFDRRIRESLLGPMFEERRVGAIRDLQDVEKHHWESVVFAVVVVVGGAATLVVSESSPSPSKKHQSVRTCGPSR